MNGFTDKPGYAFGDGPPKEVVDFLKLKENRPSWNFREVEPEEHAVAFTVAKSAGFDILDDVRDALQRALEKGETFETFRKNLAPTLQAKGWWGEREEMNPATGERRIVQLGSPRRLRTIYRANMRSARAAGQWQRIERTKAALPYLLYLLGPSERHRPSHLSKAGLVLPVDDPFWREWMPPNGWGCKCHVRQITAREAGERGISNSPDIPREERVNPETGERRSLPRGLDPAWAGNPGLTRLENAEALLEGRLDAMLAAPVGSPDRESSERLAAVALRDIARSWRVSRLPDGPFGARAPIGRLSPEVAELGGFSSRVVTLAGSVARKTVGRARGDDIGEVAARINQALEDGPILSHPDGGLISLGLDGEPEAGRSPLFVVIRLKEGDARPFVSTVFDPNSTAYIWNKMREGAALLRDTAAFAAWRRLNPAKGE